jgi:hypothetical protein
MNLDILDPVLVLTPVLVLAVVLMLGFAGCGFEGQAGYPSLTFRVRIPSGLKVTVVVFGWESPSTQRDQKVLMNPSPEDPDLFEHDLYAAALEAWTVRCEVRVQGGPSPGPVGIGMFTLDGSLEYPIATFQAAGGAPDLAVTFVGVTEGAMQPA